MQPTFAFQKESPSTPFTTIGYESMIELNKRRQEHRNLAMIWTTKLKGADKCFKSGLVAHTFWVQRETRT